MFKKLYKKRNGKILEWMIEVNNHSNQSEIRVLTNTLGSKACKTYSTFIDKGKNIGKINETTHYEQACSEANSKIHTKLVDGYVSIDIPDKVMFMGDDAVIQYLSTILKEGIDNKGNVKPMLANNYYKSSKNFKDKSGKVWKDRKYYYLENPKKDIPDKHLNISFPCYGQPKLNGVRCLATITDHEVILTSKKGTEYSVPHISSYLYGIRHDLLKIFNTDKVILDGELYLHNTPLETIVSSVAGKNDMFTPPVQYIIYDYVDEYLEFYNRLPLLLDTKPLYKSNSLIDVLSTFVINNNEEAQKLTDRNISVGYEGSIFRNFNKVYMPNKRLIDVMVKLKRVIQKEFTITDIIPQEKDPSLGLFVFTTKDLQQFEINPTFSKERCKDLLENKDMYINKEVTLTFYEYTDAGIPKHCIDTIIRDYE